VALHQDLSALARRLAILDCFRKDEKG
jgi:hypothetical protein